MREYSATQPLYVVKANLFKGLSHPHRVRVLEVLSQNDEAAVSELMADTSLEASHLSQHLAVLRKHNLVVSERRGSQVYYRLAHPEAADLLAVARKLLGAILEDTRDTLTTATSEGSHSTKEPVPIGGGQ